MPWATVQPMGHESMSNPAFDAETGEARTLSPAQWHDLNARRSVAEQVMANINEAPTGAWLLEHAGTCRCYEGGSCSCSPVVWFASARRVYWVSADMACGAVSVH